MKIYHQYPWRISVNQAGEIQTKLSPNVILKSSLSLQSLKIIAAADVHHYVTQLRMKSTN